MRKIFHSVAEVLRSDLADNAVLRQRAQQKTDRVMRATRLEDSVYQELRCNDVEMDALEEIAAKKLKTFPALSRDVFQSLYSLSLRQNAAEALSATARKFNAYILDHVVRQEDYPTLKSICEGRSLPAYEASVEAVSQMLNADMKAHGAAVAQAVSCAVRASREKAEEVQGILCAWSNAPSDMRHITQNAELLERVRRSERLRDISRYLGRFREFLAQSKKNDYAYGRGETYSLELGNDLSRALTSELAMLATPETIPLFLRKYQARQIKQYRRREPIYKGKGDIICCLDESGSTEGDAAAWGKAVAMALLEIAAENRRSFALVHFAGSEHCKVDIFRYGQYTAEDKLTAAETFLGGGTNFERPLHEAVCLMETQGFEKADVVFITDGECALSDEYRQSLQAAQTAHRFTITGILLDRGQTGMDFSLKPFCQKIYRTSELTGDEVVSEIVSERI